MSYPVTLPFRIRFNEGRWRRIPGSVLVENREPYRAMLHEAQRESPGSVQALINTRPRNALHEAQRESPGIRESRGGARASLELCFP